MIVLITGGTGFIGSNLSKRLISKGMEVRIIDNLSTGKMENIKDIKEGVSLTIGDILNVDLLEKVVRSIDYVVHLAAITSVQKSIENPDLTYEVNVEGTRHVLEFSKRCGVKRVVFASSCAVYGNPTILPVSEESELSPLSPYSESKIRGEELCLQYLRDGLDVVVLRFFNVFGPKQHASSPYSGVISSFINKILNGEKPLIYGDGEQTRDFIYVDDVVHAIEKALFSNALKYRVYNIGRGESFSVNQIFEIIREISNFKGEPGFREPRKGEVRHTLADISRAKEYLGWRPEVNLKDGLKRTFEYMAGGSNG